jgi:hypothetical protein
MSNKKKVLVSVGVAIVLTGVSNFIGVSCHLVEPGGVSSGWHGLPIPFRECGAWGDSFSVLGLVLDVLIFAALTYVSIGLFQKKESAPNINSYK